MSSFTRHLKVAAAALTLFSVAASAQAQLVANYKVKVTNLTKGISFTPTLAVTHNSWLSLFEVGKESSLEVERVAEGGDIGPLRDLVSASEFVYTTAATEGLLAPGANVEFNIDSTNHFRFISFASMALPTNDTLVSGQKLRLPTYPGHRVTYYLNAYDAGTETNDELCANIPGPHCGGSPFSPDDLGEGLIYPSPAIHGEADLSRAAYNWQGNVAKVEITKLN